MAGVRSKKRSSGKYQGWYLDYTNTRRWFEGTRTKAETLRMAQKLEDEHRQIRLGYAPLPSKKSYDYAFVDVLDEYLAWGRAQGGRGGRPWGKTHLRNRKSRLIWWHEQLGETLDDIKLSRVEARLRQLQEDKAPKTVAAYAETLSAFCIWCVQREYLDEHPLKNLNRLDTTPLSYRRAMTVEEITRLLEVCAPFRRLCLETAFVTGLRANELRNLTVNHLNMKRCGLILDADWTKNRKPGFQPLPTSLAERLRASSGEAMLQYQKFYAGNGRELSRTDIPENPLLYVPSHTARSLDYDLQAAGIPKVTPEGKLDFHAVRLAYINLVIESGANVKEAQVLARHSTPEMTMNVYGRARDENLQNTVERVADAILRPSCVKYVSNEGEMGEGDHDNLLISKLLEPDESELVCSSIPAASTPYDEI